MTMRDRPRPQHDARSLPPRASGASLFIRLTLDCGGVVALRLDRITGFSRRTDADRTAVFDLDCDSASDESWSVRETPDEILALIDEARGADALKRSGAEGEARSLPPRVTVVSQPPPGELSVHITIRCPLGTLCLGYDRLDRRLTVRDADRKLLACIPSEDGALAPRSHDDPEMVACVLLGCALSSRPELRALAGEEVAS